MQEAPPTQVRRVSVSVPIVNTTPIDPLTDLEWDRLVATHPNSTFFHSSAWARVLHGTYGHQPFYHRFYRGDQLVAILPTMEVRSAFSGRRGTCLPFTDACEPLYFGKEDPAPAIMDHLREIACSRKWKHFEVRGKGANLPGSIPSVRFYNHILGLRDNPDDLYRQLADPVRRAIKKAEQHGLSAETATDLAAVSAFYRLHIQTRKRHGLPPQPFSFFRNIYEHVIKARLGFVVLTRRGSCVIAAAVFLHAGRKAIYKFGASDVSQQEFRGNNLTMWTAIKTLSERGFETLDLGRTSLANHGLRRFKQAWGTAEQVVEYSKYDAATQSWVTSQDKVAGFHNKVFRAMPTRLNRLAGALLYPHLD